MEEGTEDLKVHLRWLVGLFEGWERNFRRFDEHLTGLIGWSEDVWGDRMRTEMLWTRASGRRSSCNECGKGRFSGEMLMGLAVSELGC